MMWIYRISSTRAKIRRSSSRKSLTVNFMAYFHFIIFFSLLAYVFFKSLSCLERTTSSAEGSTTRPRCYYTIDIWRIYRWKLSHCQEREAINWSQQLGRRCCSVYWVGSRRKKKSKNYFMAAPPGIDFHLNFTKNEEVLKLPEFILFGDGQSWSYPTRFICLCDFFPFLSVYLLNKFEIVEKRHHIRIGRANIPRRFFIMTLDPTIIRLRRREWWRGKIVCFHFIDVSDQIKLSKFSDFIYCSDSSDFEGCRSDPISSNK